MSKTITIPTGVGNPVSVVVNGRKFSYPAGTTQTVPDEVAAIFESNSMEHVSYGRRAGAPLSAEGPLNDNEFLPVFATSDGRLRIRKIDLEELIHSGVVANPTLAGTEADLTGLQVGDTKYKVPEGGGGGVMVTVTKSGDLDSDITYTMDKTWAEINEAAQNGPVGCRYVSVGEVKLTYITSIGRLGSTYWVAVYSFSGSFPTGEDGYATNSENGYPSFYEGGSV